MIKTKNLTRYVLGQVFPLSCRKYTAFIPYVSSCTVPTARSTRKPGLKQFSHGSSFYQKQQPVSKTNPNPANHLTINSPSLSGVPHTLMHQA